MKGAANRLDAPALFPAQSSDTSGPAPPAATVAQQANNSVPFRAHIQSEYYGEHKQQIICSPITNGAQALFDELKTLSRANGKKHTHTKIMNLS